MHSKNKLPNQKKTPKRSFIEEARRAQIIDATIDILADFGYVNLSFVRVAKLANISPSLISYHFKDKQELLSETMSAIFTDRIQHIHESLRAASSVTDRLRIAIESDMAHMGEHPKRFVAQTEINFNIRNNQGKLVYTGEQDAPTFILLHDILVAGQKSGEFGSFDPYNVALIIDAARNTFLAQLPLRSNFNLEKFTKDLVDTALLIVRKGVS